jgi:hypothetical protein
MGLLLNIGTDGSRGRYEDVWLLKDGALLARRS